MLTKVHEVRDDDTENDSDELRNNEFSTLSRLCSFRLPDGDCGGVEAIPDSSDYPANKHLGQAKRGGLENRPDDQNRTAVENASPPAEYVTVEQRDNGADDATDIVRRNDLPLDGGIRIPKGSKERGT